MYVAKDSPMLPNENGSTHLPNFCCKRKSTNDLQLKMSISKCRISPIENVGFFEVVDGEEQHVAA